MVVYKGDSSLGFVEGSESFKMVVVASKNSPELAEIGIEKWEVAVVHLGWVMVLGELRASFSSPQFLIGLFSLWLIGPLICFA